MLITTNQYIARYIPHFPAKQVQVFPSPLTAITAISLLNSDRLFNQSILSQNTCDDTT